VHVTDKGDGTLVFTFDGGRFFDGDNLARGLFLAPDEFDDSRPPCEFRIEVGEPEFVAEMMRERWWDRVQVVARRLNVTMGNDVPGPFDFCVHVRGNELWIRAARVRRTP
jgi:hypothetical protein